MPVKYVVGVFSFDISFAPYNRATLRFDYQCDVTGACLARHVRRTRIADIAIIHFKTSFVGYRGRGVPRPLNTPLAYFRLIPHSRCAMK